MTFGDRLHELRQKRGWTQEHLGRLAMLQGTTISMLEQGNRYPGYLVLRRLAQAFRLTISELMEGV